MRRGRRRTTTSGKTKKKKEKRKENEEEKSHIKEEEAIKRKKKTKETRICSFRNQTLSSFPYLLFFALRVSVYLLPRFSYSFVFPRCSFFFFPRPAEVVTSGRRKLMDEHQWGIRKKRKEHQRELEARKIREANPLKGTFQMIGQQKYK